MNLDVNCDTGRKSEPTQPPEDCGQSCVDPDHLGSLEEIVRHFIQEHRPRAAKHLQFYKDQPSLKAAIEMATPAKLPNGKRFSHQRRTPQRALEKARDCLLATDLQECTSFSELIERVNSTIRDIKGIGELTIYDTARHIGAYLGLEPEVVYLHRGTREGAKAIGLGTRRKTLRVEEFPEPFHNLTPGEIEDCLCIYKEALRDLGG